MLLATNFLFLFGFFYSHSRILNLLISKHFIKTALFIPIFLCSLAGGQKKVLLIGIDGCRSDALILANTPNIDQLIDNGIFIPNASCSINNQRTRSGPGWSTMLTGVWFEKHGVTSNSFKGSQIDRYPPFNVLMKRKNKNFKMASFIMWKPIEKHIIKGTGEYYKFFSRYNDELAIDVSKYIVQSKEDAIFIDFDHVDRAGHIFGFNPKGKRYVNAIEKVDRYVGLIIESLQKRNGYQNEEWLIIITSDHGGIKRNHGGQSIHEKTIPIILSGSSFKGKKITRKAYLADIVPTIFYHYEVEIDSSWSLDGFPLGD